MQLMITFVKCFSFVVEEAAAALDGNETGRCKESLLTVMVFSTLLALDDEPARLNIPVIRLERSFLLDVGSVFPVPPPAVVKSVSLPCLCKSIKKS